MIILIPYIVCSQIYYWVDENGVKHYSSTPPPDQANVNQYQEKETTSPEQLEKEKQALQEAIAEQDRGRNFPKIVMYATQESKVCQEARNFFRQNGIPYTEYLIDESEERYQEFEAFGGDVVPYIFVGNKKVRGWSEATMRLLLDMNN